MATNHRCLCGNDSFYLRLDYGNIACICTKCGHPEHLGGYDESSDDIEEES